MDCMKSFLRNSCAGMFLFAILTGCAALQEPQTISFTKSASSLAFGANVLRKSTRAVARYAVSEELQIGEAVYAQMEEEGDQISDSRRSSSVPRSVVRSVRVKGSVTKFAA